MSAFEEFRIVGEPGAWCFEVGVVGWDGPHTPFTRWKPFRTWKTPPPEARLERAKASARKDPRFFRTCTRCHELTNAGHMHNDHTCQSCAERHLGVVH